MEIIDHFNEEILAGNEIYVKKSHHHCESEEAKKHAVIITCMDSRISIPDLIHLKPDQVYVLRNAGGRITDDMVRSSAMAIRLFKVDIISIIHHTDCGLEKVDDQQMRQLFRENLGPSHLHDHEVQKHNRDKYHSSDYVAFLAFEDLEQSVINDVARLRENALISKKVGILGYVLNIKTGKLKLVAKSPGKIK